MVRRSEAYCAQALACGEARAVAAQYRRLPATARLDGAPTTQSAHRSVGRSAASVALDPTRGDPQSGLPFRARVRVAIRVRPSDGE
jgi:hypothetical protein